MNIYDECFSEERYQEEIPLGKALFKLGRTRTIALLDKIPENKVETFFEISEKIINDEITTEADKEPMTITRLKFLDLMSRNQLDPKATYKILPLET